MNYTLKSGLGKLDIPDTIEEDLIKHDMEILRISFKHLNEFRQLPRHHKDPLDRMIISQAIADNIPVISYDDWFKAYDIEFVVKKRNETTPDTLSVHHPPTFAFFLNT